MRRFLQVLVLLVILGAIGVGAIAWWSNKWLQQPIGSRGRGSRAATAR
jgi:hypothetical protein